MPTAVHLIAFIEDIIKHIFTVKMYETHFYVTYHDQKPVAQSGLMPSQNGTATY